MSKLSIDEAGLYPKTLLLPFEKEEEVNGLMQMVKIKYAAQVTSATEELSKKGDKMLKLIFAIDHPSGERIYIDRYFSYSKKAVWLLAKFIQTLGLPMSNLDTDDFLGQWVWVTIEHREYEGKTPDPETGELPRFKQNQILSILKTLSAEELNQYNPGPDLPI